MNIERKKGMPIAKALIEIRSFAGSNSYRKQSKRKRSKRELQKLEACSITGNGKTIPIVGFIYQSKWNITGRLIATKLSQISLDLLHICQGWSNERNIRSWRRLMIDPGWMYRSRVIIRRNFAVFLRPRNSLFRRIRLAFSLQKQKHESLVWDTRARKSPSLWHACDLPITFDGLISRSNRRWTFSGRRPATRLLRASPIRVFSSSPAFCASCSFSNYSPWYVRGVARSWHTRAYSILWQLLSLPIRLKTRLKSFDRYRNFQTKPGRRSKGSRRFVAIFIFALLRAHAAFVSRLDFYL